MNRAYRIGVVGCGMISETYIRNIQEMFSDTLVVRGVYDRNSEKAQKRAEQFALPCCYCSLQQLLEDSQIDIVLDLCQPASHFDVNLQALEAGKHVYSEKPLAVSFTEGARLVAFAREKGLRIGCAPDTALGAMVQTARELVDAGAIGRMIGASANLIKQGVESWHPAPDFLYQPGGGPLMDMGPYYLTALLHIAGPFAQVEAMDAISFLTRRITSQPRFGEEIRVRVPTYVNALLKFREGGLATFTATFDVCSSRLPFLEIYGETGTLSLSDPNCFGGRLEMARPGEAFAPIPLRRPYTANCRGLGLRDMAAALADGGSSKVDGTYALHILEVMTAISDSAGDGVRRMLTTSCQRPTAMAAESVER